MTRVPDSSRGPSFIACAALAVIVIPLALTARWHWFANDAGPEFSPRPDAVEIAAGAQSIADVGQYYLQIGPHRAHPRYPPGWSAMLAVPLRLGLPSEQLWRVTGLFGAALAWFLGCTSMCLVVRWPGHWPDSVRRTEAAGLAAGLVVGVIWALAPLPTQVGHILLSDEPTAFLSLLSFGFLWQGLREIGPRARGWMFVGGLLFGITASMRTGSAALMVPALGMLGLFAVREAGWREVMVRGAWATAGLLVPVTATCWLMWRSGYPAFAWSGYAFWTPRWHGSLADTFRLHYATAGNENFSSQPGSHLLIGLNLLTGRSGLNTSAYLLRYWPIVGWSLGLVAIATARKQKWSFPGQIWTALALALWCLSYLVLFSLYFYPGYRYYLVPLTINLLTLGTPLGLLLRSGKSVGQMLALAMTLGILVTFQSDVRLTHRDVDRQKVASTRATVTAFNNWLALSDEARHRERMPFESVHAQALGLLRRETADQIRSWGKLKNTEHVIRLRMNGYLSGRGPEQNPSAQSPLFILGDHASGQAVRAPDDIKASD